MNAHFAFSHVFTKQLLASLALAAVACGGSGQDLGSDEGAAHGVDTTLRHIHCDVAVAGKGVEFDVPLDPALTADQQAAKECINDRPSIFDADAACPGPALTFDKVARVLAPGMSTADLGAYYAVFQERQYNSLSGFSSWSAYSAILGHPDEDDISSGVGRVDATHLLKVTFGSEHGLAAIVCGDVQGDCIFRDHGGYKAAAVITNDHPDNSGVTRRSMDSVPDVKLKVTDTCLWVGGTSTDPSASSSLKHQSRFAMVLPLKRP